MLKIWKKNFGIRMKKFAFCSMGIHLKRGFDFSDFLLQKLKFWSENSEFWTQKFGGMSVPYEPSSRVKQGNIHDASEIFTVISLNVRKSSPTNQP
jgi:hypothetical protein